MILEKAVANGLLTVQCFVTDDGAVVLRSLLDHLVAAAVGEMHEIPGTKNTRRTHTLHDMNETIPVGLPA